jgi:hypothetical protein
MVRLWVTMVAWLRPPRLPCQGHAGWALQSSSPGRQQRPQRCGHAAAAAPLWQRGGRPVLLMVSAADCVGRRGNALVGTCAESGLPQRSCAAGACRHRQVLLHGACVGGAVACGCMARRAGPGLGWAPRLCWGLLAGSYCLSTKVEGPACFASRHLSSVCQLLSAVSDGKAATLGLADSRSLPVGAVCGGQLPRAFASELHGEVCAAVSVSTAGVVR